MPTVSAWLDDELVEAIDDRLDEEESRSEWLRKAAREQLDEPTTDEEIDRLREEVAALGERVERLEECDERGEPAIERIRNWLAR